MSPIVGKHPRTTLLMEVYNYIGAGFAEKWEKRLKETEYFFFRFLFTGYSLNIGLTKYRFIYNV